VRADLKTCLLPPGATGASGAAAGVVPVGLWRASRGPGALLASPPPECRAGGVPALLAPASPRAQRGACPQPIKFFKIESLLKLKKAFRTSVQNALSYLLTLPHQQEIVALSQD